MGVSVDKPKTEKNKQFLCAPDILHFVSQNKQYIGVKSLFLTFVRINSPDIPLTWTVLVSEENQFRIRCLKYEIKNNVDNGK